MAEIQAYIRKVENIISDEQEVQREKPESDDDDDDSTDERN